MGQRFLPSTNFPIGPLCSVRNQIWCRIWLPEGQKVPYRGKADPLWSPPDPPWTPRTPSETINDCPNNQYNPFSFLITHQYSQNAQMSTKTKKVPKNGQKCKKCKNAKHQNWPMLIPHPTWTKKNCPKTIECKEKSGWVKIHQKRTKMQFIQKELGQIFLNQTFMNVLFKTFPKR